MVQISTFASLAFMAPREGGNTTMIFVGQMLLFFAIFYFILIRPQKKEQERKREMIKQLGKGDEIMTAGGIIGKIVHVDGDKLTIKSEETRLFVDRSHVTPRVQPELGS